MPKSEGREPGPAGPQAAHREDQRGDRRAASATRTRRARRPPPAQSADEGDEAAERHGADRSRPACTPAGCGRNASGFGPTRDQLADGHTKLSKALLAPPASSHRGARATGPRRRSASLASRTPPRRTPRMSITPPAGCTGGPRNPLLLTSDRLSTRLADLHQCANSQVRRPRAPRKSRVENLSRGSACRGGHADAGRHRARCWRVRRPFPSRSSPPPAGPGRPLRRVRRRSAHPAPTTLDSRRP